MSETKLKFQLNTEIIVAVVFLLFIFAIPISTLVGKYIIAPIAAQNVEDIEDNSGDDKANAVLDGNGTNAGLEKGDYTDSIASNSDTDNSKKKVKISDEQFLCFREPEWFAYLKGDLNDFTDSLVLRKELIRFNTDFSSLITGNTYLESTQVLKGREGYLFFKSVTDGNPIGDYMGTNHLTETELFAMAQNMKLFRDAVKEKYDADVIYMGIPNKENIYSEYMPDTIPKINEVSKLDQVTEYMQTQTDLVFLNPKEDILKEKENYQVYYKTDTHWNEIGAYIGTQSILMGYYGNDYIGPDGMEFTEMPDLYSGDLATIAGIEDEYKLDTVYMMVPSSRHYSQYHEGQVIMIIGDSFSGFLKVTTEPFFEKAVRIDRTQFTESDIAEIRPDLIVVESVERYLELFNMISLTGF